MSWEDYIGWMSQEAYLGKVFRKIKDDGLSDCKMSPLSVSRFILSSQGSRIRLLIDIVMFGRLIKPCWTPIGANWECWRRSLVQLSKLPGPVRIEPECGTLFLPNGKTHGSAYRCSFNPQNFWVTTILFAALRDRPVPRTLAVVTNTDGFPESWNLSSIAE